MTFPTPYALQAENGSGKAHFEQEFTHGKEYYAIVNLCLSACPFSSLSLLIDEV